MKKTLFLMSATALTLVSCSQEEVLNVNRNVADSGTISFRVRTSKIARAQDVTSENLEAFNVFAHKGLFDDLEGDETIPAYWDGAVTFTKNEETGYFESEKPYYWPTDGSWLSFNAYAPVNAGEVSVNGQGELSIQSFTVNEDIKKQVDLVVADCPYYWAAAIDPVNQAPDGISLDFEHALSKVYVSAAMNSDDRYKYEVAGVKFGNIVMKADYLYNDFDRGVGPDGEEVDGEALNHQWFAPEDGSGLGDIEYIFDNAIEIDGDTKLMDGVSEDGSFMMIPQILKSETVKSNDEDDTYNSVTSYVLKEGVSYIALLIRVTYVGAGEEGSHIVYPYGHGEVDLISREIDDKKYAWAAFPIGSPWVAGKYIDYKVDFSKGAGFVAPGAGENFVYDPMGDPIEDENGNQIKRLYDYTPILGDVIKFTETVGDWTSQGDENTVDQEFEGVVNVADFEDPFGE